MFHIDEKINAYVMQKTGNCAGFWKKSLFPPRGRVAKYFHFYQVVVRILLLDRSVARYHSVIDTILPKEYQAHPIMVGLGGSTYFSRKLDSQQEVDVESSEQDPKHLELPTACHAVTQNQNEIRNRNGNDTTAHYHLPCQTITLQQQCLHHH